MQRHDCRKGEDRVPEADRVVERHLETYTKRVAKEPSRAECRARHRGRRQGRDGAATAGDPQRDGHGETHEGPVASLRGEEPKQAAEGLPCGLPIHQRAQPQHHGDMRHHHAAEGPGLRRRVHPGPAGKHQEGHRQAHAAAGKEQLCSLRRGPWPGQVGGHHRAVERENGGGEAHAREQHALLHVAEQEGGRLHHGPAEATLQGMAPLAGAGHLDNPHSRSQVHAAHGRRRRGQRAKHRVHAEGPHQQAPAPWAGRLTDGEPGHGDVQAPTNPVWRGLQHDGVESAHEDPGAGDSGDDARHEHDHEGGLHR
mmetsp:Transcript_38096/g.103187  ORF Transcript_38096/g.103187 Transcript_38096/m.103187 type:complete len:311 (-) Transcript_38096:412-1344(-)